MQSETSSNSMIQRVLQMSNDSTAKTLIVALVLCLVCSVFVSAAAVILKPLQEANKARDLKNNILSVAGLQDIVAKAGQNYEQMSIADKFKFIETRIVDLRTGEYADDIDAESFDLRQAARDPQLSAVLDRDKDRAGIGRRPHYAPVYLVKDGEQVRDVVIPIYGKGLWSTLYGFLSLRSGELTVQGISFYDQKETPGLGGEVENPTWQATFKGKLAYDEQGKPRLSLVKGGVDPNNAAAVYQVDALSGATLTSRGVTNLLQFWLGESGFGTFLHKHFSTAG